MSLRMGMGLAMMDYFVTYKKKMYLCIVGKEI